VTSFLIDAQLPYRLAQLIRQRGYDAVHTRDLTNGNRTTDAEINLISIEQARIVITKDADFVESFVLRGAPHNLQLIATGNIDNNALLQLVADNLGLLTDLFQDHCFVELSRGAVITHH